MQRAGTSECEVKKRFSISRCTHLAHVTDIVTRGNMGGTGSYRV